MTAGLAFTFSVYGHEDASHQLSPVNKISSEEHDVSANVTGKPVNSHIINNLSELDASSHTAETKTTTEAVDLTTEPANLTNTPTVSENYKQPLESHYYSQWLKPKAANIASVLDQSTSSIGGVLGSFGLVLNDDFTHGSGYFGLSDLLVCNPLIAWLPVLCPSTNRDGIVGALDEATTLNRIGSLASSTVGFAKVNVDPQDGGVCKAGSVASAVVSTRGLVDNLIFTSVLTTYYKGKRMETKMTDAGLIATTPVVDIFNDNRVRDLSFRTQKPYDTIQVSILSGVNFLGQVNLYHTKCTQYYEPVADQQLDTDSDDVPDYIEQILGLRADSDDSDGDGISDSDELNYLVNYSKYNNDKELLLKKLREEDSDKDGLIDAHEKNEAAATHNTAEPAWDFYYSQFDTPRRAPITRPIRRRLGFIDNNADYGVGYLGITDIVCNVIGDIPILCPITNPSGVASRELSAYTSLARIVNIAGSANVWARINVPAEDGGHCKAGSRADMTFSTRGVIDGLLSVITVRTYKDGKLQERKIGEANSILSAPIVSMFTDNEVRSVGFVTSKPFDSVHLNVASLGGFISSVNVYHARCSKGQF